MTQRSIDSIEPPDCYARARQLAAEVELIRHEMGRPAEPRAAVTVAGASPREVYFQALAVFRKADRLCQEITGDPVAAIPHVLPVAEIKPGHVLLVIEAALRELAEVKHGLGIKEAAEAPARDASKVPSDVFGALATANRQINLLLERPFRPTDVYQQVSLAVAYAARLTDEDPPAPAAFERGKRPADVYARLTRCLDLVRGLVGKAGHPVIERAPDAGDAAGVSPSDVFDLASLVLAEVAFLHALRQDPNPPYPFEGNAPGRKLPSHVDQLAGVLERQLAQLAA